MINELGESHSIDRDDTRGGGEIIDDDGSSARDVDETRGENEAGGVDETRGS
jgi:hypothetical protein